MATFINKKEQVLEIELTSYGKYLTSVGKFKPKYYAFYDGDIIYNGVYAGLIESQNDIVDRIKTTPRTSVQTKFSTLSASFDPGFEGENLTLQFNYIKPSNNSFFKPIGTSDRLKEYAPAWLLRNMSGSVGFSGSATYNSAMSIPSLTSSIETKYKKRSLKAPGYSPGQEEIEYEIHELLNDEHIILDIQEINTRFKTKGNYEIEVFVEPPNEELPKKLFFIPSEGDFSEALNRQTTPSEMLRRLNGTDSQIEEAFPTLDNTYVEYFLNIQVDNEIEDVDFLRTTAGYYNAIGAPVDPCGD